MTKYILIILFIIIFPGSLSGQEWLVEKNQVKFSCDCEMYASEILIGLRGGCPDGDFRTTEKGISVHKDNPVCYVLSSWEEFLDFKGKYFVSSFFDVFKKEYFYHHRLAVVLVKYSGNNFIKNEKLYKTNEECGFSYEIWDRKIWDGKQYIVSICARRTLYVIKLKRDKKSYQQPSN